MRFLSGQNAIVQGGTLIVLLMDQKLNEMALWREILNVIITITSAF